MQTLTKENLLDVLMQKADQNFALGRRKLKQDRAFFLQGLQI
jgi:hypothetical protein